MSDFSETWSLVRGRFGKEIEGLSTEQLNWRLHPKALTIGEQAIHVAGVEVSFLSQLTGVELDDFGKRVAAAATEGVVLEKPFPFTAEEINEETIDRALSLAHRMVSAEIDPVSDEIRSREIKSALGPIISGTGAFCRLAYHPGYHQAQVHMIKTAPGFPG